VTRKKFFSDGIARLGSIVASTVVLLVVIATLIVVLPRDEGQPVGRFSRQQRNYLPGFLVHFAEHIQGAHGSVERSLRYFVRHNGEYLVVAQESSVPGSRKDRVIQPRDILPSRVQ